MQKIRKTRVNKNPSLGIEKKDSPFRIAFKKYLAGDLEAYAKAKPEYKDIIEKYVLASKNGKSAYQTAQDTGISSNVFGVFARLQRSYKRRMFREKTHSQAKYFKEDFLKIVEDYGGKKCTTAYVAKKLKCDDIQVARHHLRGLEKAGKIKRVIVDKDNYYWVLAEVKSVTVNV